MIKVPLISYVNKQFNLVKIVVGRDFQINNKESEIGAFLTLVARLIQFATHFTIALPMCNHRFFSNSLVQ